MFGAVTKSAARRIGSQDPGLCNALAIAARSPITTPELRDTPLAKEEHEAQIANEAHQLIRNRLIDHFDEFDKCWIEKEAQIARGALKKAEDAEA